MGRGIWPLAVPTESSASSPNPSPSHSHQSYSNNNNNNYNNNSSNNYNNNYGNSNRRETPFSGGSSRSAYPEIPEFRTSNHGENRTGRSTEGGGGGGRERNRTVTTTGEGQGGRRNDGVSRSSFEDRQRINSRSSASSAQPNPRYSHSSILSYVPPVDWRPKRFIVKFRQQMEYFRFSANCEFSRSTKDVKTDRAQMVPSLSVCGFEVGSANFKFVLKPTLAHHEWKFLYEPLRQDIHFLSGKIPLSNLLTFQVGIGHDFAKRSTKLRWNIASAWGGPSAPTSVALRKKTTLPICPGLDVRAGWAAEYSLPHLHGSVGMGANNPAVGLNVGRISASVDRIETIFTNMY